VTHGGIVATTEAIAIIISLCRRNMRTTQFVVRVYVGPTMAVVVMLCSTQAVAESLPLCIPKLAWRRIPTTTILRKAGPLDSSVALHRRKARWQVWF